jgi:putative drug exporter of the RND superfamily
VSVLLYRLGHACARHRYPVIGIWLAAVVGLVIAASAVGEQTSQDLSLPGTDSTEATDLLDAKLPKEANGTVPLVLESSQGRLDSGSNERAVKATVRSLEHTSEVRSAVSPLSSKGADALSKDGKIGYISLTLYEGPDDLTEDEAQDVLDAAQPAEDAGLSVSVGSYVGQELSRPSTEWSERLGIAAAIIILLVSLGTVPAMLLPIAIAITGVATGLSLITLLGHLIQVPQVASTLGTMIGLGVGIDYSLFVINRYRQRLAAGVDVEESIARAAATSGSAVAFAGGTVVIALLSLVLAGIPIVSALGYCSALVVLVAVLAANTLMPAALATVGSKIEALRVRKDSGHHDDRPHGWARWAEGVAKRPWFSMIAAVGALVVLALPIFDMKLGQEDVGVLPEDVTARQAYDGLTAGFGVGANGPMLVAVDMRPPAHNDQKKLDQLNQKEQAQQEQEQEAIQQQTQALVEEGVPEDEAQQEATQQVEAQSQQSPKQQQQLQQQKKFLSSTASDPRLVKLENRISKTHGVKDVSQAKLNDSGTAAVFTVTATTAPSNYATSDLVRHLRDTVIPDATAGTQLQAHVGGTTAGYIDLADRISDKLPQVILTVVLLSVLLLLLAFRTVLVPITAAIMNLLSVAASYGVLTAVFEKGWGNELIGLDRTIPIESFVPLFMFAILFGLSMDYQVFLVSRIGELHRNRLEAGEEKPNRGAVVDGLASSARVITSAALIMVSVFASFVLNGDPTVKQFGVGLAVAIAVDATIVRCVLVPSAMELMGEANWWLPRWLDRVIPRVGLETEDALPPLPEPAPAPAKAKA